MDNIYVYSMYAYGDESKLSKPILSPFFWGGINVDKHPLAISPISPEKTGVPSYCYRPVGFMDISSTYVQLGCRGGFFVRHCEIAATSRPSGSSWTCSTMGIERTKMGAKIGYRTGYIMGYNH